MLNFSGIVVGNEYKRKWLAKKWGYKGYQAFAKGVFCPKGGGQIILFATKEKRKGEEQYKNYISQNKLYWEGEKGHGNDERIITSKSNCEEILLFYRDHHKDPFEYKGTVEFSRVKRLTTKPSEFVLRLLQIL